MYEDKCSGSVIKMPSQRVRELAIATIDRIRNDRKELVQYQVERRRESLQREKEKLAKSFWSFLYRKKIAAPIPTDEEILKDLNTYYDLRPSELHFINSVYSDEESTAYRLLNAAKYADEINLTTKDLEHIT